MDFEHSFRFRDFQFGIMNHLYFEHSSRYQKTFAQMYLGFLISDGFIFSSFWPPPISPIWPQWEEVCVLPTNFEKNMLAKHFPTRTDWPGLVQVGLRPTWGPSASLAGRPVVWQHHTTWPPARRFGDATTEEHSSQPFRAGRDASWCCYHRLLATKGSKVLVLLLSREVFLSRLQEREVHLSFLEKERYLRMKTRDEGTESRLVSFSGA